MTLFCLLSVPVFAGHTDAELEAFCQNISDNFQETRGKSLVGAFDMDAVSDRWKLLGAPDHVITMATGKDENIAHQLASSLFRGIYPEGSFEFLQLRVRDGKKHGLFRILPSSGGFNYLELLLEERAGKIVVGDIFNYNQNRYIVESTHQAIQMMNKELAPSFLEKLTGSKAPERDLENLGKMLDNMRNRNYEAAMEAYYNLPESIQRSELVLSYRIMLTSSLSQEAHARAVEDFHKYFPKAASVKIMMLDYLFYQKRYDELYATIASLNEDVGGDPYLTLLSGMYAMGYENWDKAVEFFEHNIKNNPEYPYTYDYLAAVHLTRNNFAGVVNAYSSLEKNLDFFLEPEFFTEDPDFAEFVKSPEFKKWKLEGASETEKE